MNATKEATGTCRCDKHSPILDGTFTANEMIDAYMRGQQSISQMPPTITAIYSLLKEACSIIKDLYDSTLKENGCFSIFIQMVLDKVNVIAVIDEDTFFDDKKSRFLYKKASDVTRNNKQISISYMPCREDGDINKAALLCDNYFEIL